MSEDVLKVNMSEVKHSFVGLWRWQVESDEISNELRNKYLVGQK